MTLATVQRLSDEEIEILFKTLRWGEGAVEACTRCGAVDHHYRRRGRRRTSRRPSSGALSAPNPVWQCRHCYACFSITSGTLLDSTRLTLRTLLSAAVVYLAPGNGCAAMTLSGLIGVTYKTAFLLHHRFQEAMAADVPTEPFTGIAQMDGGYFCGKPRKPNRRVRRVTREQLQRRYGKTPLPAKEAPWDAMGMTQSNYLKAMNKRTVLAVTDSSAPPGCGSRAVVVGVSRGEHEQAILSLSSRAVAPGTMVMTDEAGAYTVLGRQYEHEKVSHAREFSTPDGVNDNHCEAFFSRLRRLEYGVHHGFRPRYLHFYAHQAAWRHNHRRWSKEHQVRRLLEQVLALPPSTRLRGYYAGRGVRPEVLVD